MLEEREAEQETRQSAQHRHDDNADDDEHLVLSSDKLVGQAIAPVDLAPAATTLARRLKHTAVSASADQIDKTRSARRTCVKPGL